MEFLALANNERIIYKNIGIISDKGDYIRLTPAGNNLIEIQYNGHTIARTYTTHIEKRCLVCNEIYLDIKDNTSEGIFKDLDNTVNEFFHDYTEEVIYKDTDSVVNEVDKEDELPFQ